MIDRLQVAVRLRGAFEALDLGQRLVRAHWKPIYLLQLMLVAPLALLSAWIFRAHPWVMPLIVWWLKPWWSRPALHVLARATFGQVPGVRDTLRALPSLFRRGALASILWRRGSLVRSLALPLWQLEGQGGAAFRRRRAVLMRRGWPQAALLTCVSFLFQIVVFLGLFAALEFFVPQGSSFSPADKAFESDPMLRSLWVDHLLQAVPVLAMMFIEPFYIAGGFGLYLNRRVELEGWDIELAFRRLGTRLASLAAGALLLLVALSLPLKAQADPKAPARAVLQEVQRQPEFQTTRTKTGWHWKEQKVEAKPREFPEWLKRLFDAFSVFGKAIASLGTLLKVALLLAVAALVSVFLWRYRGVFLGGSGPRLSEERPTMLFGLDLRPESLPTDVPSAALALWRRGEARAALALLYRAALADLVNGFRAELSRGATEGECLRAAQALLPQAGADYFRALTCAWQGEAYAGRRPEEGEALCQAWSAHFRSRR